MEGLELHSLILEELSVILSFTCEATSKDRSVLDDDPAVRKIVAQCPPPPNNSDEGEQHTVNKRQENAMLALANIACETASETVRKCVLKRVLAYLEALPRYRYQSSALGVSGVPAEHWFVEQLVSRLLQCAAQSPADSEEIVEGVWAHVGRMVDVLETAESERAAAFGLPVLLGTLEALEKTQFRFRATDVLRADTVLGRLLARSTADQIHAAVSGTQMGAAARRTVTQYQRAGVGVSANHVVARFLVVVRAVLESRLAVQLVARGALDAAAVDHKDAQQLWDVVTRLGDNVEDAGVWLNSGPVDSDGSSQGQHEQHAYSRILAVSLQLYSETRTMALEGTSDVSGQPATTTTTTGESIMGRCLYTGALAALLRGRTDTRLVAELVAHVHSEHVLRLTRLTVVAFRVLAVMAAFFPESREVVGGAVVRFVTDPPRSLVDGLPLDGEAGASELTLLSAAAAALGGRRRAESAAHTLFNALAVQRMGGTANERMVRVSRNVIVVLSQLALRLVDADVTALIVGMVCAPRFVASAQLVPLVVQRVTAVAPVAAPAVFDDIVAAVLKRIAFGDGADESLNTTAGNALTRLAARIGDRRDLVEGFFCAVLRFFVDTSIAFPAPSRFRRRELTPLAVLLPVLHALVCTRAYALDREADVEQISLWRNFWLHMVARGYLLEKSYVAAYGRIYAALAARSPILVHPSSVNYLVTEIEYSSVLQRESSDASLARLHRALAPLSSTQPLPLLRTVSFAQAVFLFAAYSVELARASAGNCATVLAYFGNSAVATSPLLPAIESIATLVIAAYVRETTSRRWSVEAALASAPLAGSHTEVSRVVPWELSADDQEPPIVVHKPPATDQEPPIDDQELFTTDQEPSAVSHEPPAVVAQVRELMVASCHHLQLVSTWAQRFVDRIMHAFPQALLDPSAVRMLLELVQLVWKSCKAEQDDQFVPVYWFTSRALNLTLQFPDSISYRKALFTSFSACAKRWLEIAAAAAPMELEALLQVYLSSPSDDDLNYEPHIGHSLALDVANSIRYSRGPPVEVGSSAIVLPPNSSSFIYRLGQRDFLRGCIGRGAGATSLKILLSDVYVAAKERPGEPLPEDFPSMREITETISHAAHYLVATPRIDRELARLLVWVPLTLLDDSLMRATSHAWTMLIVERPDVEVLIMVELTIAWTWLIQQHLGLFSKRFEPRSPFAAKMSYTPSDKSARARAYAVISHTLAPHMLLIEFLAQRFDSVKHLPYCNFAVISAILRILQVTFDNVDRISSNALARGPLFMLVHLGFKLLKLGFESSPILEVKLRNGLYDLAFRWFALPPCWSFSGSKATLAKEIHILIDTRHTVKSDSPVLRSVPSQFRKWTPAAPPISPGSSSSTVAQSAGSNIHNATGTNKTGAPQPLTQLNEPKHEHHHHYHLPHPHLRHLNPLSRHWRHSSSRPHSHLASVQYSNTTSASSFEEENSSAVAKHDLILDTSREQLKQQALRNRSLLLVLLENEICRMATWANPTDQSINYFPDVSRFARNAEMSDAGWQNLVVDAWTSSPRLAVQLIQRFSHPAVRRELVSLICKFPGELVQEPEALPLLIEQLHFGSGSGSLAYVRSSAAGTSSSTGSGGIFDAVAGSAGSGGNGAPNGIFNNLSTTLTFRELKFLLYWCAVPPITAMSYLASSHSRHPLALQYSMRSLECFPVDTTFFYIPQMVQALRHDSDGYVERAILSSAQISQHFAHQIIWNMKANVYRDEEGQEPDSLKPVLDRIVDTIVEDLSGDDRAYYEMEFRFFGEITGISGKLKPFIKKSKPEKKRKIDEELRQIKVEPGVYLPSNPDGTVVDIDYDSGRPLQSHAKAPFMATFVINRPRVASDEVQELLKRSEHTDTPSGRLDPEETPISDDGSSESSADISQNEPTPLDVRNNATHPLEARIQDLDAGYLASKLESTKIQTQRTVNSAISDAPDLIGISLHSPKVRSGRPSRDSARTYSLTRDAVASNNILSAQTPQMRDSPGVLLSSSSPLPPDTRATADIQTADKSTSRQEEEDYEIMRLSAIFKVGDDCRQDVLALQLIAVFKNIFTSCGLDLYLYPYRVVATAPGRGVIDVIPNSISRDQMGREKVNSLSDYFATKYHGVDSIQYQQARTNFVQSLAAYSVLSYLLQFKDRHNGNIMLDDEGHIVHIDFGFILDIAPGGITFESAPFKLTTEYVQVMGGSAEAQPYRLFCELCIKAYLACRPYAEKIIQVVALMLDSGLPCFKGESTLLKLRSRFQLDRTERDAAQFMADRISDSHENKRTVMYDQFQKATNGIPY